MRETSWQETPPTLAGRESAPPQDGEIRARWAWVEASVWTPRMLKALETGLGEGRKWFRLIDKVWSEKNLQSALKQVLRNGGSAGVDGGSVAAVARQSAEEMEVSEVLCLGSVYFSPVGSDFAKAR